NVEFSSFTMVTPANPLRPTRMASWLQLPPATAPASWVFLRIGRSGYTATSRTLSARRRHFSVDGSRPCGISPDMAEESTRSYRYLQDGVLRCVRGRDSAQTILWQSALDRMRHALSEVQTGPSMHATRAHGHLSVPDQMRCPGGTTRPGREPGRPRLGQQRRIRKDVGAPRHQSSVLE